MGGAWSLGHTRGRDVFPRGAGEPGALADDRASAGPRVCSSDDPRRSRAGVGRRHRSRAVDLERARADSRARQPVVRPSTDIGSVGAVRGLALRIERAVQSTPRRLPPDQGGPAGIRSGGPTTGALKRRAQARTHAAGAPLATAPCGPRSRGFGLVGGVVSFAIAYRVTGRSRTLERDPGRRGLGPVADPGWAPRPFPRHGACSRMRDADRLRTATRTRPWP